MTIVELILIALATARLTRLVTADKLTEGARNWVLRRLNPEGKPAYLLTCDWCASMYTSVAVVGVWHAWGESMWAMGALAVLAASYVTGALAAVTGGE